MQATHTSENSFGADNEQGSPSEIEIAWLAGIIDGEGWIGLQRQRRTTTKRLRYSASATITTTSPRLASKIHSILERLGVRHYFLRTAAKVGKDGSQRREKWDIKTSGNARTAELLRVVLPYLVEKDNQARLVLSYVEWRESQPTRPGGHADNIIQGMKDRAEETMAALREDRTQYDPSEIIRLASAA